MDNSQIDICDHLFLSLTVVFSSGENFNFKNPKDKTIFYFHLSFPLGSFNIHIYHDTLTIVNRDWDISHLSRLRWFMITLNLQPLLELRLCSALLHMKYNYSISFQTYSSICILQILFTTSPRFCYTYRQFDTLLPMYFLLRSKRNLYYP